MFLPLFDVVDASIACSAGAPGKEHTWDEVTVAHLKALCYRAKVQVYGDDDRLAKAASVALEVYRTLWEAPERRGLPTSIFANAAVNRLVNMMTVILCRRVGIETAGAFQRHLEQWREVTELLGLSHGSNALYRYSLAPGSKAMMVYAEAIAAHGERKLTLNVRRAHVFEDAWRALHSQGTLRGQPGSHKVFPSFFSVENGHQVFEHGEGHGPRKEFFLLA